MTVDINPSIFYPSEDIEYDRQDDDIDTEDVKLDSAAHNSYAQLDTFYWPEKHLASGMLGGGNELAVLTIKENGLTSFSIFYDF